jgi:hypothetical protein
MKNSLIQQCLDIIKREDTKYELRSLMTPVINIMIYELQPYIYIIICLFFLIFIMILAILILLITNLRNTQKII